MSKPKLDIWNERMLLLIKEAKRNGIVEYEMDFCTKIGFDHTNLHKVRERNQGFRIPHIVAAAEIMDVSTDWICGLTKYRKRNKQEYSPIELIKEGLKLLEDKK